LSVSVVGTWYPSEVRAVVKECKEKAWITKCIGYSNSLTRESSARTVRCRWKVIRTQKICDKTGALSVQS